LTKFTSFGENCQQPKVSQTKYAAPYSPIFPLAKGQFKKENSKVIDGQPIFKRFSRKEQKEPPKSPFLNLGGHDTFG
jgi:hypothetical protein